MELQYVAPTPRIIVDILYTEKFCAFGYPQNNTVTSQIFDSIRHKAVVFYVAISQQTVLSAVYFV
jgi:hypothetical protein